NRFGSKILRGEHELLVYDLRRESSAALCDAGARWIDGPAAMASEAEVIITSLPSPSAVERVTLGSDGLVNLMPRGAIYVDMSTSTPWLARDIAAAFELRGVDAL